MRRVVITVVMAVALVCGMQTQAQYNREYFFWMGRTCMMNNHYQDAIRTLNTLLRVDEDAFEGYFLRGIAKYNLDDLIGAEADFSTAIRLNPVYTQAYTYRAITARGWAITTMPCKILRRLSSCVPICRAPIIVVVLPVC